MNLATAADLKQHYIAVRKRIDGRQLRLVAPVAISAPAVEIVSVPPVVEVSPRHRALAESDFRESAEEILRTAGPRIKAIAVACSQHYDCPVWLPFSRSRVQPIPRIRAVAMCLTRDRTPFSMPMIARKFGGFDHTTALHHIAKARRVYADDVAAVAAILGEPAEAQQ